MTLNSILSHEKRTLNQRSFSIFIILFEVMINYQYSPASCMSSAAKRPSDKLDQLLAHQTVVPESILADVHFQPLFVIFA